MSTIAQEKTLMLKHLNAAIKLEQIGVKKYTEFAKKTQHYYGKLMFERLALEEEKHTLLLESWKERLDNSEPEQEFIKSIKLESIKAREIFPVKNRDKKGITKDYVSALTYAITIEDKSYTFYKELEQMTHMSGLKNLFRDLAKFESEHMRLFKSELEYVQSNPMSI